MQLWRLGKSTTCREAVRLGIQGRAVVQVQRQPAKNSNNNKTLLAEFPLAWGRSVFVIYRPSPDRTRPTHSMEGSGFTQCLLI